MHFIHKINDNFTSIEYCYYDGQWTLPNSFMLEFYKDLRYRHYIFYNIADIDKWNPIPYFRSVKMWIGIEDNKVVGGYWLSTYNPLNKSGFFNCAVTKKLENRNDIIRIGHLGLETLLNRDDVKTIYAETSITNIPVLVLAKHFGFQNLGIVPGGHYHSQEDKWVDTQIMYINKDTFK
jgi:RimJ/RimL family protein N-acetyltransferase